MEEKPYMVSNTIRFSDGTETVTNYTSNPDGEIIEKEVSEQVSEVSGTDFVPEMSPVSSSEEVTNENSEEVGE